jgi:hypothetical protein
MERINNFQITMNSSKQKAINPVEKIKFNVENDHDLEFMNEFRAEREN